MRVYFVRHGITEHNTAGQHQPPDVALSPEGVKQSQFVAKRFRHSPINIILSSPFKRTQETAQIIGKALNHHIEINNLLHERIYPSQFAGLEYKDPQFVKARQSLRDHINDPGWHLSDEENYHDIVARAKLFVTHLQTRPEEHILVVTHAMILRCIVMAIIFGDRFTPQFLVETEYAMAHKNTGITVCEYGQLYHGRPVEWRLITWNDHAHLS